MLRRITYNQLLVVLFSLLLLVDVHIPSHLLSISSDLFSV